MSWVEYDDGRRAHIWTYIVHRTAPDRAVRTKRGWCTGIMDTESNIDERKYTTKNTAAKINVISALVYRFRCQDNTYADGFLLKLYCHACIQWGCSWGDQTRKIRVHENSYMNVIYTQHTEQKSDNVRLVLPYRNVISWPQGSEQGVSTSFQYYSGGIFPLPSLVFHHRTDSGRTWRVCYIELKRT